MPPLDESFPVARKPPWLKAPIGGGAAFAQVRRTVREHQLHTVCESASCPNIGECWADGTATYMILGNTCTRGCRFCDVDKGRPGIYDRDEPFRIAESVLRMGVKYAVITSVTRDDLPDQGSEVWADTLAAVRQASPGTRLEALTPDFQGKTAPLDKVLDAAPDIFNHNFETVARLQREVRGRANVRDSSAVLRHAKARGFRTKSSFMLGVGETRAEISEMIGLCADLGVDIVTFGQYLQPTLRHLPVRRYVPPEEFESIRLETLERGIPVCVSGPRVRSSYHADRQSAPLFAAPT